MKNNSVVKYNRFNREIGLSILVSALMFSAHISLAQQQAARSAGSKPNIILIMADDLGYGDVGFNGQQKIKTPNLDQLAARGRRFVNFYAGSSVCAPSRESILTGYHTGHTYIRGNFRQDIDDGNLPLAAKHLTIAEVLRQAGYSTALFGKWGVGDSATNPNTRGFDTYTAYHDQVKAHNYFPPYLWENGKRTELAANKDNAKGTYSHDLFASKTFEYLDNTVKDKPFFLYLPYTLPHGEYSIASDEPYGSMNWTPEQKKYAAMVSKLDQDIGRIMEILKQKGIEKNTLVIFTSDNGGVKQFSTFFASNGIYRGNKLDLYEGGIRAPFVASWPGTIIPGTDSTVCAAWDLLPTLANIGGAKIPDGIDGQSLMNSLQSKLTNVERTLYWEYYEYNYQWNKAGNELPRNYLLSKAMRFGKWKAIKTDLYKKPTAAVELYDLSTDPSEKHDVSDAHPDLVKKAESYFADCCTTSEYFPVQK